VLYSQHNGFDGVCDVGPVSARSRRCGRVCVCGGGGNRVVRRLGEWGIEVGMQDTGSLWM